MVRKLIVGAALGLSLFGAAGAQAQTSTLALPATSGTSVTMTIGGWTAVFSNCGLTLAGVNQNGACNPEQVVGTIVSGGLQLVFDNVATPSTLFTGSQLSRDDLSISETITAPTGKLINSVVVTIAGTSSASGITAGLGMTVSGVTVNPGIAAGTTGTATNTIGLGTPANSVGVTKDIFAGTALVAGSGTVTSVTQVIKVPEPATMSVLGVGLAGLFGLRRRMRAAG